MATRWRYVLAGLAFASAGVQAMGVDELVAKNLEARGGAAKLQAITTLKESGKMVIGGQFEVGFVAYRKAPDSSRSEVSLQGLTAVQAWDGHEAWQISPFQGRKDPEKMSADDARALADDASIGGPLLDWRAAGSRLEYLGTEDVDGTEAHKLKVTRGNGDVEYVYLDPDHWLEIRKVSQRTVRGTQVVTVEDYGDYEQVDGVWFPFSIASESKGDGNRQQLTIEKAEANVPLEDALFAFPASAKGGAK